MRIFPINKKRRGGKMKRFLTVLVMVFLLLFAGLVGADSMKVISLPGTDLKITIPEQAPEFFSFPSQLLSSQKFPNGNAIMAIESMNKEGTVDVIAIIARVNEKVSIIAIQVNYCPESFQKFDQNKKHQTDYYQDSVFMNTGKFSGVLVKVDKIKDYAEFSRYIEGAGI
jgi:hypothetical protein